MKRTILAVAIALNLMCGMAAAEERPVALHTYYVVQSGDTLEGIARMFYTEDRYMPEFMEGIVELNYDRVFKAREQAGLGKTIYPGDIIEVYHRKG